MDVLYGVVDIFHCVAYIDGFIYGFIDDRVDCYSGIGTFRSVLIYLKSPIDIFVLLQLDKLRLFID
jgi:hypothetical protein